MLNYANTGATAHQEEHSTGSQAAQTALNCYRHALHVQWPDLSG